MRTLILHEHVDAHARPDELDVLVQADFAERSLWDAGYDVARLALDGERETLIDGLARYRPEIVFNLVESLGGSAQRIAEIPSILEERGVAFTGASSAALRETTDKLVTKRRLRAHGLPTPDWIEASARATRQQRDRPTSAAGVSAGCIPQRALVDRSTRAWILKPIDEDGSVGIDEDAVVVASADELAQRLSQDAAAGCPRFAEAYVEGRELNVSVLGSKDGLLPLPVAEIVFDAFPVGKPRIVGYTAKWDPTSFEYQGTPRRFDFPPADQDLVRQVETLACACAELFELGGYARVDFRIDAERRPWILEVNANPCLAPDAGFVHAAARAQLPPAQLFQRLVELARTRGRG